MNYVVTIKRTDDHVFNNGFETLEEVREFIALAALVLLPGETVSYKSLHGAA